MYDDVEGLYEEGERGIHNEGCKAYGYVPRQGRLTGVRVLLLLSHRRHYRPTSTRISVVGSTDLTEGVERKVVAIQRMSRQGRNTGVNCKSVRVCAHFSSTPWDTPRVLKTEKRWDPVSVKFPPTLFRGEGRIFR